MKKSPIDSITAPANVKKAIYEFVNKSLGDHKKNIKKMIIYGSVARGKVTEDSDVDILVVWNGSALDAMDSLGDIALKILLEHGIDISIHPMTPKHYEYIQKINSHFIRNVERDGIVVA
jgi:predicted nucleotidyltransferase